MTEGGLGYNMYNNQKLLKYDQDRRVAVVTISLTEVGLQIPISKRSGLCNQITAKNFLSNLDINLKACVMLDRVLSLL